MRTLTPRALVGLVGLVVLVVAGAVAPTAGVTEEEPPPEPAYQCDLTLQTSDTPPSPGIGDAIGEVMEVVGTDYPPVTIDLGYIDPSSYTIRDPIPADDRGHFSRLVYFTAGSQGDWEVYAIDMTVGTLTCVEFVPVFVITGHPFADIGVHPFESEIAWLYQGRVTAGCAASRFCPDTSITRGQMAAFLVRALGLPATTTDFFTDVEASIYGADVNRLAASGITTGCTATRFCPTAGVTRQQMASFLVRGLGLPAATTDFFADDETSIHEIDINRLAASRITGGCGGTRFCPGGTVSRGQMAAFLERALFDGRRLAPVALSE